MPNISNFSDLRKDHKQNKPSAKSMKSKDKVPDYRPDFGKSYCQRLALSINCNHGNEIVIYKIIDN